MNSTALYEFLAANGEPLTATADDAVTAFHKIKKADKNNYFKLKRFERNELVPEGFSALDIGYGLSLGYKRTPISS